jgi:integrase
MHSTAPRKALAKCIEKANLNRDFTVHGFRHTFNNLLRQATEDGILIQSLMGHASPEMTERYSNVELAESREVVGKLLRLVRGGG